MRTLGLLLAFLALSFLAADAQEPDAPEGSRIKSAQVSGLDFDRLSPGLRQDVNALAGTPLDWGRLSELASRIEAERPDTVAAVRAARTPDGEAQVVFLVARISDEGGVGENINARYIVESVEIEGVPEGDVSEALRNDLQALVGVRLDREKAERLRVRIRLELRGYDVDRRIVRGSRVGQIRVIFEVRKGETLRWIPFVPSSSKFLYHSDQGWSGVLDVRMGERDFRVTPLFALDNGDDLIEEYSGYGVRIEQRRLGSERLGARLELTHYDQTWEAATLSALSSNPTIAEAYRDRSTVAPALTFAFSPQLHVTAGVSISELESLSRTPASQTANAAIASIGYRQRWERKESTHSMEAGFFLRSSSDALQSDLDYTRYFGSGRYEYRRGRNIVTATAMTGHITGQAPLFERFTLGDSSTLRGWNKYDIAPAGGDRMFHTSLEYSNRGLAFFLDTGSAWDEGTPTSVRAATGFGYHGKGVFLTLGFRLNTTDVGTTFMMGVRF